MFYSKSHPITFYAIDLMFYCKTDDVVICTKCILTNQQGGEHSFSTHESSEERNIILSKEIKRRLEELNTRTNDLQSLMSMVTDKCGEVHANLNKFRKRLLERVDEWCTNYLEKIDSHYAEKVELLLQQLDEVHNYSETGQGHLEDLKSKATASRNQGKVLSWLKCSENKGGGLSCFKHNCILFGWSENQENWLVKDVADDLVRNLIRI
jgi:hypothetical protein